MLERAEGQAGTRMISLRDYALPTMPAEHALRALWRRFKRRFESRVQDPVIASPKLKTTTALALDDAARPPACGPLLEDFDDAVATWLAEPSAARHFLVILPPCDDANVIDAWARSRGFTTLEAPPRAMPGDDVPATSTLLPQAPEGGLLVIPNLERWFLRRRTGLVQVRALLHDISRSQTPCLIGCNSWAWAFLVKAASADLMLSNPMTFRPFDADRLGRWFSQIAGNDEAQAIRFRLASSGDDVLERNAEGTLKSSALQQLAARSLGIPWTAWHLWRQSLRTGRTAPDSSGDESADDAAERVLWIEQTDDVPLPAGHEESSLLVLHALLLHGSLDEKELAAVLPDAASLATLPALVRGGFISLRRNEWAVAAEAYPAIRNALKADGYPVGAL